MISVSNLKKSYNKVEVLHGISFDIAQGEFFGLLGPNGAGKTTIISIMSSILEADEGSVKIAGKDLQTSTNRCKKIIGVVPQEIALYNELSAYDNLMFWGSLYDIPTEKLKKNIETTLQLFGLSDRKNDKIKTYSGGMKRRINIASALLHDPKVLFMDEPTVGIDPQSRNLIYEVLEKLHDDGMTFVYTTHYMEEAERFCTKIGIIDAGNIVGEGSLEQLKKAGKMKETITVTFSNLSEILYNNIVASWTELYKANDYTIHFYSSSVKTDLSKIILKCSELGMDILNIEIHKVNLETIFLDLTGKQLRDQ